MANQNDLDSNLYGWLLRDRLPGDREQEDATMAAKPRLRIGVAKPGRPAAIARTSQNRMIGSSTRAATRR